MPRSIRQKAEALAEEGKTPLLFAQAGRLDLLESGFVEFFEKAAPANPLKAEYLLPIYIDELLHADKVSVKVLPTHDKWFGVTYAEDKQTVIDSFARLVADGVYKKDLFSDLKK